MSNNKLRSLQYINAKQDNAFERRHIKKIIYTKEFIMRLKPVNIKAINIPTPMVVNSDDVIIIDNEIISNIIKEKDEEILALISSNKLREEKLIKEKDEQILELISSEEKLRKDINDANAVGSMLIISLGVILTRSIFFCKLK